MIVRALEETAGNVTAAAKMLGLSRRTMHRRIKELRLDSPASGNEPSSSPPNHGV
jgi:transcriptional regulator of acetoin/glycerol metabolism